MPFPGLAPRRPGTCSLLPALRIPLILPAHSVHSSCEARGGLPCPESFRLLTTRPTETYIALDDMSFTLVSQTPKWWASSLGLSMCRFPNLHMALLSNFAG